MSDRVRNAISTIEDAVAEFDPARLSAADAAELVSRFAGLERVCVGVRTVLAARAAESDVWKGSGARSGTDWLARETGCTRRAAHDLVARSNTLHRLDATRRAVCAGRLSDEQVRLVVDGVSADPNAEDDLLAAADTETVGGLRRRVREIRHNAATKEQQRAQYDRLHRNRRFGTWTDEVGGWRGSLAGTPIAGAEFEALLKPFIDDAFAQARRDGRREPVEAYRFDALMAMARAAGAGGGETPSLLGRVGKVIVRLDHTALVRGHTVGDEICEIAGYGPVPVSVVEDLLGDAFWAAVLFDGDDVATVAHLGRRPRAVQQTAVEARDRECQVAGCNDSWRLELDHELDWSATHRTAVPDLDLLCHHHHRLKTTEDWRLEPGSGKRRFLPPGHPDHPGRPRRAGPSRRPAGAGRT